jgi:hypothetical protein
MPEQSDQQRAQRDRLDDVIDASPEENAAQRQSDAPPDATAEPRGDRLNTSDRAEGRGSDANGIPAFDEADGENRKRLYDNGADLVSRID